MKNLSHLKNSLIETHGRVLSKNQRIKYIQLVDQFLIDLNEEIVDLNGELTKDQVPESRIEEYRTRVNDLI